MAGARKGATLHATVHFISMSVDIMVLLGVRADFRSVSNKERTTSTSRVLVTHHLQVIRLGPDLHELREMP